MLRCEDIGRDGGFVHLSSLQGIEVDLRYAGVDNFSGHVLYAGLDCAWLRLPAAQGLERAALWLRRHRPSLHIRVLDALRPQRIQEAIWREVVDTPMARYFAEPKRGSIHSFGMAVDVTLADDSGRELDMGSGFDEMNERSHPSLETRHLALGILSAEQLGHRGWLYEAMAQGGFVGIPTEWWHFDQGDREQVRREFERVE